MELGRLIEGMNVRLDDVRHSSVRVCDITEDSRTVLPGSLYIARRGGTSDGNAFTGAAISAGAVAVLSDDPDAALAADARHPAVALLKSPEVPEVTARIAERFYDSPSSRLLLVGVTGTNGKTTTACLIHQLLNAAHVRCGLIGTVFVDDGTEVAPAAMTTPPALEISRTLARMLDAGCRAAVLEVSSHSLMQGRVAAMEFDAGVFTNLTGDHLDYHGTMDAYAGAKARLFGMLPATGVAVINADDPASARMARGCAAPIVGATLGTGAVPPGWGTARARIIRSTKWGMEAIFSGGWGETAVTLPFVGSHNLMNALEASACVWSLGAHSPEKAGLPPGGLSMGAIARALGETTLPPGRLQRITSPDDPVTVYVDYAHTDDALRTVLGVFRGIMPRDGAGRLIVVFGCGGDRDATKRPRMGSVAAELADRIYVTSDNPRTEDPRSIIDAIIEGMPQDARERTSIEPERERAIRLAIGEASEGDVVVIAGKGHEDYQILPGPAPAGERAQTTIRRFFDDRLVAREALTDIGIHVPDMRPASVVRQGTAHPRGMTPRME